PECRRLGRARPRGCARGVGEHSRHHRTTRGAADAAHPANAASPAVDAAAGAGRAAAGAGPDRTALGRGAQRGDRGGADTRSVDAVRRHPQRVACDVRASYNPAVRGATTPGNYNPTVNLALDGADGSASSASTRISAMSCTLTSSSLPWPFTPSSIIT